MNNLMDFENELKARLKHQLKLVPETQRDLFVTELAMRLSDTSILETMAEYTVSKFCRWYFGDDCDKHPIGGDYFGIWGLNDEFWDFSDIMRALDVKNTITPAELQDWYWETTDMQSDDKPIINLKSYIMGVRYDT